MCALPRGSLASLISVEKLMLTFVLSTFAVTTLGATALLFVVQIVDDLRDV